MSKKITTILANPVVAKLHNPDSDVRLMVSEMLSYKVAGAEHMGMGNWDGYNSMFRMKTNTFPAGFLRLVKKKLELGGRKVLIKQKPAPSPLGPQTPKVDDFGESARYDYQMEAVNRLVKLRAMIAQCATGSGKSRIFKLANERLGMPSLFITTRKSLMYQMAENYESSMKKSAGILGDGKWDPRPDGNSQV